MTIFASRLLLAVAAAAPQVPKDQGARLGGRTQVIAVYHNELLLHLHELVQQ